MAFTKQASPLGSADDLAGNATAADLDAQVKELRHDIAELAKTLAAMGSGKIDAYKAGIDRLAADAVDVSTRALDRARTEAVTLEESFERQVRDHPLQSLAIAAGIGFLAAHLSRRG